MKLPEEIRQYLVKKFQRHRQAWLYSEQQNQWPLEIPLGMPTEKIAAQQSNQVRHWIHAWQTWKGVGTLIFCQRHWSNLGSQRLPQKLILQNPEEVAAGALQQHRWEKAKLRYHLLTENWPQLKKDLPGFFNELADYSEEDFQRLLSLLTWLIAHPQSSLYPRELPIPGLDSKWLEKRKKYIGELIAIIKNLPPHMTDFYQRTGLKPLPQLIRLRILDPNLRNKVSGLCHITIPEEELTSLKLSPKYLLIVENLQSFLACSDLPETVLFLRPGYDLSIFSQLSWIKQTRCFYWGDIDTHGFAILNQVRKHIPHIKSVLMDETTLLKQQALWGVEEKPSSAEFLPLLTQNEQALYHKFKQHHWRPNLRLEQERIDWHEIMRVLHRELV